MAWIVITVAAAFMQNVRSLLQKKMTGALSVGGAGYTRFLYALPFAVLYLGVLAAFEPLPVPHGPFMAFVVVGAVAQILATVALLASFERGQFAVGTAVSKTEVIQTALVGYVVLAEPLGALALLALLVSFAGVWVLSAPERGIRVGDAAVGWGLLAGAAFAVAAVCFRGAALALPMGSVPVRAAVTLVVGLTVQVGLQGAYLLVREPGQLKLVLAHAPMGAWVGLAGAAASAGWFTAMTLESAALVRAVAQVELLFAFATGAIVFRERIRWRAVLGVLLIVTGLLVLLGSERVLFR